MRRITQVRRLFPKARIAVAVSTRKDLYKFWHALEKNFGEKVGLIDADHRRHGKHVVVCTYQQLPVAEDANILLLPNAVSATGELASRQVAEAASKGVDRVYGFVAPVRNSHRTSLAVEGLCGPLLFRVGPTLQGVRVVMLKTSTHKKFEGLTGLERKRKAYWGNASRNKFLARVVRSFVGGDAGDLHGIGLILKRANLKTSFENGRVVVLVESAEHGRELLKVLPEGVMVHAAPQEGDQNTNPEDDSRLLIVTVVVAARYGIDARVIVRATGGGSPLNIKNFPPVLGGSETFVADGVLLVDFDDDFDREARNDTATRLRDYEARGFCIERKGAI